LIGYRSIICLRQFILERLAVGYLIASPLLVERIKIVFVLDRPHIGGENHGSYSIDCLFYIYLYLGNMGLAISKLIQIRRRSLLAEI